MAASQRERDRFIGAMAQHGATVGVARAWLRRAATAQRLAEASCNGDYPADNGERKVHTCPKCGGGWVRSSFRRGMCPDCAHDALMCGKMAEELPGWALSLQGDPRGYVVRLIAPNGDEIGVPS